MKTLDEVIAELAFEMTYNNGEMKPIDVDALHYLKTIETTENLYYAAVNELSKWKDEDWKDRFLPLTWDELKLMEGSPVWVEWVEVVIGGSYLMREWFLIEWIDDNNHEAIIRDRHGNQTLYRDGSDWRIYRKEHK